MLLTLLAASILAGCVSSSTEQRLIRESVYPPCIEVNSCVEFIHKEICKKWFLPPSATKDLRIKLRVFFSPKGKVLNVVVIEASGNEDFDRSALYAIKSASPFDAMVNLDEQTFEEKFAKVTFVFNPEVILASRT